MKWSTEYPLDVNGIAAAPRSPGVYEILQATAYPRYYGDTRVLKIGMSKKSLRSEMLNHLNRHTAANRIIRVKGRQAVTFHYCEVPVPDVLETEKALLRQYEDEYWDLPVLNSTRGYERGKDLHYCQADGADGKCSGSPKGKQSIL